MTTVTVDDTMVGQIIATDGKLVGIVLKTVPTTYGSDYLSLVSQYIGKDINDNDVVLQEDALYHLHIGTSPFGPDSVLLANGRGLFSNLVVKDIPPGCTFDVETGPLPVPPALTSLSPNTAISGDPDFVLSCIGSGFGGNSVIKFGDFDEPTTLVSDTEVTTIVKPSLFAPAVVPVWVHEGPSFAGPIDFTFTAPAAREE